MKTSLGMKKAFKIKYTAFFIISKALSTKQITQFFLEGEIFFFFPQKKNDKALFLSCIFQFSWKNDADTYINKANSIMLPNKAEIALKEVLKNTQCNFPNKLLL